PGTITRTYSVTDEAGNSITVTQDITVDDTTDPVINCPADITQNVDAGLSTAVVTYTAPVGTDNCGIANTVQIAGLVSGSAFPVGTTTNTFEVTDDAGNTMTCSFDVTVVDSEAPVINCPADITQDTDAGVCEAVVTYTAPVGTDNSPGAVTVQIGGLPSGSTFPIGTTTNTFEVTDATGLTATCSFDVTIEDNEDPTASDPAGITVECIGDVPASDITVVT
ncbi:HYR domain-containing protein, partial [Spongiimicrobium sp. 3-5]|uniref:HYR domain-containing protein n=1 Tax=Spongiimicrobium sp. 3-5 TaxID=3332596 RepID=UPI00397F8DC9